MVSTVGSIIELMIRDNDFGIAADHFISLLRTFIQGAIIGQNQLAIGNQTSFRPNAIKHVN